MSGYTQFAASDVNSLRDLGSPVSAFIRNGKVSLVRGSDGDLPGMKVAGWVPPISVESLGDQAFLRSHAVRYPYIGGALANGISSVRMVTAMASAGMLCFYGAGGLNLSQVQTAILEIQSFLGTEEPFGVNLLASPQNPQREMEVVQLFHQLGVRCVCASGFAEVTPSVVFYRVKGLQRRNGSIESPNRLFAKISRPRVAREFMQPPPDAMLQDLFSAGLISSEEVHLASGIPVAQDVTAEADSGGHTDNRPLGSLFPVISGLAHEISTRYGYSSPVRVGVAGGIGTPAAVAAAFGSGAAFVLTGSINQACVEAGTSSLVKEMLCDCDLDHVGMAPAGDMFEYGSKVQVLTHRNLFASRARKLWEIYRSNDSLEGLPAATKVEIEHYLHSSLDSVWAPVSVYLQKQDPGLLIKAERDPKMKMALVLKSYFYLSSRWAIEGSVERQTDFQIWCSPAMGAFNRWVRGTFLEPRRARTVVQVAHNLMYGGAVLLRARLLAAQGLSLPPEAFQVPPVEFQHRSDKGNCGEGALGGKPRESLNG